ncbi:MAG: tRNA lysidine(34) synthetase TilS [Armatimonadota bacterium]
MSNTFIDTVRKTITQNNMIRHGDRIIVAVSGGADSVALLHVLWQMKDEFDLDLIAAHMNHGIRGEDADRDALFVQALADRLKIASVVEKVDVPAFRKKARLGLEEAARKVRYDFLENIASDAGAARIAVAHTADDQVETVLLNIIRGTGPDGISGMPAVRGRIIRPLIDTFRTDIEAYLRENGLDWVTDVTNIVMDYTRNRVRLQLIPFLEDQFNPKVKDALLSLSRLVRDENEAAKAATEIEFSAAAKEAGHESVVFDASKLRNLPRALLRRCIRKAIELVKGDLRDVEYIQTERIADSVVQKEDVALTLPSGKVYARLTGDELRIFRIIEPAKIDIEKELEIGGRTEAPELDILFETKFVPANTRPELPSQAVMDPKKIKGKLTLRTWRRGDRILPLGMTGHKKLQDLFTDAKTPRRERVLVPVIADEEKIIWVAGYAVSELVRVTEKTCTALWIEYFRL